MQDWASAVSKHAWSKPILLTLDTSKLLEPMEIGECEDSTNCWSCLGKRKTLYKKVKPN
jgi:hypothetical protein